jgi:cytochrome P450
MNTARIATKCTDYLDAAIADGQLRQDPYPVYSVLRRDDPLCWSEHWGCWVVSRHSDITMLFKDTQHFSNAGRVVHAIKNSYPEDDRKRLKPLIDHYSHGLINVDPPDHTRLRRLVQKAFTPRTLDRLRPRVAVIVRELLDRAASNKNFELIQDFAYLLPVTIIAELLGIPPKMHAQFKAWSQGIVAFMATPRPDVDVALSSQKALLELKEYFKEVFAECRRQPREDLISDLVNVHLGNESLTEEELLSTCVTMLIGGHETTTSLLASAMHLMVTTPELANRLRREPELMPSAVEEFLRYEPPFQRILRIVREPTELYGKTLVPGDTIMLLLGSANRDPEVFSGPDVFDPRRSPNRHLSFGHSVHFCLGAALARLEAPIALSMMVDRFPDASLADDSVTWQDGMIRCLAALPLNLNPGTTTGGTRGQKHRDVDLHHCNL